MANTKLPLTKWFLALCFAATNKDGISEMALTKYIGVTLKTAWALLHKIRSAMGEREALYRLGRSVEMDEAFFGRSYNALSGDYCCDMQKYDSRGGDARLKWLHVMVSNIKANIGRSLPWPGGDLSTALP